MLVAVVVHHQQAWGEGRLQRLADAFDPVQGKVLRKGRTSTRA
jgi:hypothetical protein